ncbi:MAG: hypothetical protein QNJ13_04900 [Paracoccaceae bacterium]|nr:hypothetical protein [Paracoccaceae bacterium]
MIWFMRMARLVRNPPSAAKDKLVLGLIALVFLLWGIEQLFGWPEALTVERIGRRGP